jgi:hypothetical protein
MITINTRLFDGEVNVHREWKRNTVHNLAEALFSLGATQFVMSTNKIFITSVWIEIDKVKLQPITEPIENLKHVNIHAVASLLLAAHNRSIRGRSK